jgi:glycosyltransferase involved in cell wall biosynthesis
MLLVDAIYLNSFGGKTILELFFTKLKDLEYHIILDNRLKSKIIYERKIKNFTFIHASHRNRKNFYLKNINRFSSILCLANIPPPVHTSVNTSIFFHNSLLLNPLSHPVSFKSQIINFFKLNYIKYYNQNDYNWIVQTPYIYKLLRKNLMINSEQIFIYPIFKEKSKSSSTKKIINNFVYVSSAVSHKNHKRLVKSFIEAANKADKVITLHLTLNKEDLTENIYPKNLKVKFHGTLSRDSVNKLYDSCDFAIYPSLVESFGLPLIEAANHGCKVIASNLPYVHEIILPSLTFNPYSVESMSNSILKALESENLPDTNVLVKNKLNNFIDSIISQNVQK